MISILEQLIGGFSAVLHPGMLMLIAMGVVLGIAAGAMPGLSPSMGVALLVPFTYGMEPSSALILLVSIYVAASYGGSITAITINAPGTASAVVTALDGFPLCRKGEPGAALGVSLVASTIAGMFGTVILIFFSVPLASLAIRLHPAEYFALALFGLATVASLGGKHWHKALTAALIGLVINKIGIDPISGTNRFTFGVDSLSDGFVLIPALIGMFALSEVLTAISKNDFEVKSLGKVKVKWPAIVEYWRLKWSIFRSGLLGTLIGIFPGAGATIAAFVCYDIEKTLSKEPESFGKGSRRGIAAAESANSGSVGGALVPLLTLGIPGSATTAVLIGAMMIHKLTPGPRLFTTQGDVVFAIFAGLFCANVVLLAIGMPLFGVSVAAFRKTLTQARTFGSSAPAAEALDRSETGTRSSSSARWRWS